jgi:hypothetical protein
MANQANLLGAAAKRERWRVQRARWRAANAERSQEMDRVSKRRQRARQRHRAINQCAPALIFVALALPAPH